MGIYLRFCVCPTKITLWSWHNNFWVNSWVKTTILKFKHVLKDLECFLSIGVLIIFILLTKENLIKWICLLICIYNRKNRLHKRFLKWSLGNFFKIVEFLSMWILTHDNRNWTKQFIYRAYQILCRILFGVQYIRQHWRIERNVHVLTLKRVTKRASQYNHYENG